MQDKRLEMQNMLEMILRKRFHGTKGPTHKAICKLLMEFQKIESVHHDNINLCDVSLLCGTLLVCNTYFEINILTLDALRYVEARTVVI